MKVIYEDMGKVFNRPFRFLPYCPKCGAELHTNESPCHKCGTNIDWYDPYPADTQPAPKPGTDGDARIALQAIKELSQLIKCDQPRMSVWAKDGAEAVTRMSAILASHGQGERALREALQTVLPLAAIGLRHLRAKNDPKALQATNDLAYARAALCKPEGRKGE